MRLKQKIAKSGNTTYSIIYDYTTTYGKRTTGIYEILGNYNKLVERFGPDDTMNKVKDYIKSLNQSVKDNKELPVVITLNPNKLNEKNKIRSYFSGHLFLLKAYHDLGINKITQNISDKYKFEFDLNSVVECLVYSRIIWPASKLSTYNQSRNFLGNYSFDIQHVYRSLEYLAKEFNNIQKDLFEYSNKIINRNYKVFYYDCTNFFFYTEEDDLKRYGISKQHQPHPLVQMGLFMDGDGYPIAININPGNTAETKTMLPTEKEILNNFNLKGKNVIVCTDAAMCTDDIKKYNVQNGRGFVITQSIKKAKDTIKQLAFDKGGWRILGDIKNTYNLDEIENLMNNDESYKNIYYNAIFYKEVEDETKSVNQAVIITFSFKYRDYHHKLKKHQLERAKVLVDETNNKNNKIKDKKDVQKIKITKNQNDPKRFIKEIQTTKSGEVACNITYEIDNDIYVEEEKYNGLYGISTNLNDETSTILKIMKGRWEIEESFRIMKNDFDAGTVHLSREDRIKGHFITCFLALFVYRYLEHQLNDKYTVYEITTKLREMKLLEQKGKGYQSIQTRTDLTDDLHAFLGLNTDMEIITYKKINNFFKHLK